MFDIVTALQYLKLTIQEKIKQCNLYLFLKGLK